MTTATSSAAKAGPVPNKPGSGRLVYSATVVQSAKRDVDLFGPATVRIDGRPLAGGSPFPVLYLSAYVPDPAVFAGRVVAALAWVDDTQAETRAATPMAVPANDPVEVYSLPDYVEDVDYGATLFIAVDPTETDWRGWTTAMVRRVNLATTAGQIAQLLAANATGAKLCPRREMASLGLALSDAYVITQDQAASA